MALVEDAPGFWRMVAQYDRTYGLIRTVKRGNEIGYRADSVARPGAESELIGYFKTLRGAAAAAHQAELTRMGTPGPPNGRKASPRG